MRISTVFVVWKKVETFMALQNNEPRDPPFSSGASYPQISVVIPTYNVEPYIADTLDSLLAQSIPFAQIIIVNDGSTDGTMSVVERYAHRAPLVIVNQPNQGVGAARKKGLSLATGDYVLFCDPDDVVSPQMTSNFVTRLQVNPALELFYFSIRNFVGGPGEMQLKKRKPAPPRTGEFKRGLELFEDLILSDQYHGGTWHYIFKREVCDRFHVSFEGRAHEDHEFSMEIYLNSRDTFVTTDDLYFLRARPGSLTRSVQDEAYVMGAYRAHRASLERLKRHIPSFAHGRETALRYIEKNISVTVRQCVKLGIRLPQDFQKLMRQDVRECRIGPHAKPTLAYPVAVYWAARSRHALRVGWQKIRRRHPKAAAQSGRA
ncbi:glycosyltransferase family 2 protein [Pseudomonas sp. NPDC089401]|uniref:glycosyltransferase family 2 protein n=1 Tax=Pseudomonas sp. NPDC089401 TaxID=3364462 RepID=UPI003829A593